MRRMSTSTSVNDVHDTQARATSDPFSTTPAAAIARALSVPFAHHDELEGSAEPWRIGSRVRIQVVVKCLSDVWHSEL